MLTQSSKSAREPSGDVAQRGAMSDSEDDWETADVPEGTFVKVDSAAIEAAEAEAAAAKARAREEARKEEAVKRAADAKRAEEEAARRERGERPMILVDFTALDPNIHNRADKHAVNDVDAASALRRRIESEYSTFANDAKLVAAGTVRACSQGVYRAALAELRDQHPGHYWAACFPPT